MSVGGGVCSEILLITLTVVVIIIFFGTHEGRDTDDEAIFSGMYTEWRRSVAY